MADKLCMSQPTYSRLESGSWLIDELMLLKIAGLLAVCPEQLRSGSELEFMAAVHSSPDAATESIRQENTMIGSLSETIQHLRAENAGLRKLLVYLPPLHQAPNQPSA